MTIDGGALTVGSEVELEVGPVAHGGHCVARHEGRVVFVRHAIPGELVTVRITEGSESARYVRGDAVRVLRASTDRVEPPCPFAGPDRCGGCDFQHVTLDRQRRLLAEVVEEQLLRLAGISRPVEVEPVPGDDGGLGWRTRVRFTATSDRRQGLLKHRSHEVVGVDRCRIASPDLPDTTHAFEAGAEVATAVVTSAGERVVVADRDPAPTVHERALGRSFRVAAGDFWQVHPGAVDALVGAVLAGARPVQGERCWDLYSGVGVFAAALAAEVGTEGTVMAVESQARAVANARRNVSGLPQVRVVAQQADRFVRSRIAQGRLDVVVLDPPRSGAGRSVLRGVVRQRPRVIAYVACDPAALARDLGTLGESGYELTSLRAFDLFPMTHHVECVAICHPRGDAP